jgi:hypothetical protein
LAPFSYSVHVSASEAPHSRVALSAPGGPTSAADLATYEHSHFVLQIDWDPVTNICHKYCKTISATGQTALCLVQREAAVSSEASCAVPSCGQPSVMPRTPASTRTPPPVKVGT